MMKSLFAGAAALVLIAGAAGAQEAYDSTTTRTTTVTAPVPLAPAVPAQSSTMTVERTVAPQVFDPTRASSYHEEHTKTVDGETVEKSVKTETSSPDGTRSSSYSQTTTRSDGE